MRYLEIKPDGATRKFVRCYWILEDTAPESRVQRIAPDGRAELRLNPVVSRFQRVFPGIRRKTADGTAGGG